MSCLLAPMPTTSFRRRGIAQPCYCRCTASYFGWGTVGRRLITCCGYGWMRGWFIRVASQVRVMCHTGCAEAVIDGNVIARRRDGFKYGSVVGHACNAAAYGTQSTYVRFKVSADLTPCFTCAVVRGCPKRLGERTVLLVSMCQVHWSLGRSRRHAALYGILQVSSGLRPTKNWLLIRNPALGREGSRKVLDT